MLYPRRDFIKKTGLLTVSLVLPRYICAAAKQLTTKKWQYFDDNALIDLHCHPSLKAYLFDKKFYLRHYDRNPGINLVNQQEDVHEFNTGKVRAAITTHYLLEGGVHLEWKTISALWWLIDISFDFSDKIEAENDRNTDQVINMINILEKQIDVANARGNPFTYEVVCNFQRLSDIIADKQSKIIPLMHAVEGAHALGRNFVRSEEKKAEKRRFANKYQPEALHDLDNHKVLPDEGLMQPNGPEDASRYIANMERLWERGVCLITLSHFFANDISYPVEGISPDGKGWVGMKTHYDPQKDNIGLTPIGKKVVAAMLDQGVIVDLTHSTPRVRQDVFCINSKRAVPRPLVFSHVGLQNVFDRYDFGLYTNYKFYDLSKEEVKQICQHGDGVIGIIPELFFLAGSNRAAPLDEQKGIPYMIETMKAINRYTLKQQFDNVAIGTDFDGLATNPKDLYLNHQLGGLYQAMQADPEIAPHIQKITHGNALRLLQYGWDGPG